MVPTAALFVADKNQSIGLQDIIAGDEHVSTDPIHLSQYDRPVNRCPFGSEEPGGKLDIVGSRLNPMSDKLGKGGSNVANNHHLVLEGDHCICSVPIG